MSDMSYSSQNGTIPAPRRSTAPSREPVQVVEPVRRGPLRASTVRRWSVGLDPLEHAASAVYPEEPSQPQLPPVERDEPSRGRSALLLASVAAPVVLTWVAVLQRV